MTISSPTPKKPLLFFNSFYSEGHTNPILYIASAMIEREYEVVYLCMSTFKDRIVEAGAEFIEMPLPDFISPSGDLPKGLSDANGDTQLAVQLARVFYETLPNRSQKVVETLEMLRARDPTRQIIMIEDGPSMTVSPFKHGRPIPDGFDKLPKTIGISPVPLMIQSRDTAPFLLGLPPDSTESGRLRNRELYRLLFEGPLKLLIQAQQQALEKCQCTVVPEGNPLDAWYTSYDATLMLCSPSLEYPLSDLPPMIDFAGTLPRVSARPSFEHPDWWPDVLQDNAPDGSKKKIIFVSQGTVRKNWNELLLPTMAAFADRDDILVVTALGKRRDALGPNAEIPANVRVIDYLPFDTMLAHTDVFVTNGGYGAFGHAVKNGVPSVFSGVSEDKLEVGMRAEWAGFAVNLRTQTPSVDQVRAGVEEILGNARFRKRALELKRENEELDALSRIERQIVEFTE